MTASRVAVVDLGTNTTRLLVCDVSNGRIDELERRTEITRLGQGVDRDGRLGDPAIGRVTSVLDGFKDLIDRHGATTAVAIATSAVRDADNGPAFQDQLAERYGLDVRTISGSEEARLTFLGATSGRQQTGEKALVIDIGGGSTEFVVGSPGAEPEFDVSTAAGSVRQTERHLHDDPPDPGQLQELSDEVQAIIAAEVPPGVRARVDTGIAVAGTATSLAAISQELEPYDPALVDGFQLVLGEVERILALLAALPLDERREVPGLHPDRAPTIIAGVVILAEAIRAFGLEQVEISEADLLYGAALEAAHPG